MYAHLLMLPVYLIPARVGYFTQLTVYIEMVCLSLTYI